jgi:cytoskeletal protein CcmA (bactofilin family)
MFSKSSQQQEAVAAPQAGGKAQRAQRANAPSIISGDLVVKGMLVSSGDVQIDGRVEGDIRATSLVVGERAVIEGDIYAEDAVIRGRVQGAIRARKVQLCATCHVEGNILHEALAMEAGAFFEGNCRHSDNPLAEESDAVSLRRAAQPAQVISRPAPVAQASAAPIRAAAGVEDARPIVAARPATAEYKPLKG